jgi:hypothetical protein
MIKKLDMIMSLLFLISGCIIAFFFSNMGGGYFLADVVSFRDRFLRLQL